MTTADLQPGDIILTSRSSKGSPVSGVIKLGTLSAYSHAMLYVGNGKVVEAIGDGIVERGLSEALVGCDRATAFRHSQVTDAQVQRIVTFARSKKGGTFSFVGVLSGSGLVAFGPYATLTLPLIAARSMANRAVEAVGAKRSYFCAELVTDAYRAADLPLGIYGHTPSLMNPGDLAEYSDRNPQTLVRLGDIQ